MVSEVFPLSFVEDVVNYVGFFELLTVKDVLRRLFDMIGIGLHVDDKRMLKDEEFYLVFGLITVRDERIGLHYSLP